MAVAVDARTGDEKPAPKTLVRQMRRQAAGRDRAHAEAYHAGRNRQPHPFTPAEDLDGNLLEAYNLGQQHADDAENGDAGGGARSRSFTPPSAPSLKVSSDDGAGLLLGLIAYALAVAWIKGGGSGARQWLAAKFLNRAAPAAPAAGSSPNGVNRGLGAPLTDPSIADNTRRALGLPPLPAGGQ